MDGDKPLSELMMVSLYAYMRHMASMIQRVKIKVCSVNK